MEDEQQNYQSDENQEYDQNGGPISGALADQRVSRKRAQEDVKLLANRIALLKQEEQKVSTVLTVRLSKFQFTSPTYLSIGLEKN